MEDYKEKYEKLHKKTLVSLQQMVSEGRITEETAKGICADFVKEGEDERIRKQLIEFVNQYGDKFYGQITKASTIAWLEKQDKKIDAIENFDTEFEKQVSHLIASAINKEHEYNQNYVKWTANALLNYAKHELEKQGEIKRSDYPYVPGWRGNRLDNKPKIKHSILMLTTHGVVEGEWLGEEWCQYRWSCKVKDEDVLYWLHLSDLETLEKENVKRAEQKSDENVESKFKTGDWVVSPNSVYWHIDSINNNRYEVSSIDGACADWPLDTDLYHLWTIQDAKDSDVLASDNGVIILVKESRGSSYGYRLSYHCAVLHDGTFEPREFYVEPEKFFPATKEQRDFLFKKMKKEGYEWNPQKKELKRIELAKNKSEEELSDFESALFSAFSDAWQEYLSGKEVNVAKWTREHSAELLEFAREQKPAWSQEDEKHLLGCINYFNGITEFSPYYNDFLWLKSLKNRVQPKQEWSEEEKARIDKIINILDWAEEKGYIRYSDWEDYVCYVKSLKPQNTWKPSKEQMKQLGWIAEQNKDNMIGKELMTLYNDLKKIMEE